MCGFCGFTGQIATPEEILEKMKNKIIHRGPDSGGSHIDNGIAMGFRRLSFLDLEGGHQPIYNETRDMVITFNGEIYNHQEIREELIAKGQEVNYDQVLIDINTRDHNDSTREITPLRKADDAIEVDTTKMSIEEVVAHIYGLMGL